MIRLLSALLCVSACSNGALVRGASQSGKAVSAKEAPEEDVEKASSSSSDGNLEDNVSQDESVTEDLKVIPPEIVTGGFLTCASEDDPGDAAFVTYGCTAFDHANQRIELGGFFHDWVLQDAHHNDIEAAVLELPDDSDFQQLWRIHKTVMAAGIYPGLQFPTVSGEVSEISYDTNLVVRTN